MVNNQLDWLDEIEFEKLLTGDMKLIADRCGIDTLKKLLIGVPKIHVYLTEKPLIEAKRKYIEKFYRQGNAKEIATRLGVSEFFVYETHKQILNDKRKRSRMRREKTLFGEE